MVEKRSLTVDVQDVQGQDTWRGREWDEQNETGVFLENALTGTATAALHPQPLA